VAAELLAAPGLCRNRMSSLLLDSSSCLGLVFGLGLGLGPGLGLVLGLGLGLIGLRLSLGYGCGLGLDLRDEASLAPNEPGLGLGPYAGQARNRWRSADSAPRQVGEG